MTREPTASLEFGGVLLHGKGSKRQADGIGFDVSADGVTFGSAEDVLSVVRSFWADGSSVSQDGADNAETSFYLRIHAANLTLMGQGEALFRRLFPKNEQTVPLVWRPAADAPAAVRTVLHVKWSQDFDGLAETGFSGRRIYQVTMTHAPFVASEFETVVPALPVADVETPIAIVPLNVTTGWSGTMVAGGVTSVASTTADGVRVQITNSGAAMDQYIWSTTLSGLTLNFGTYRYLVVEHRVVDDLMPAFGFGVSVIRSSSPNASTQLEMVSARATTDGWVRSVYLCAPPAGLGYNDVTAIRFGSIVAYPSKRATVTFDVRTLERRTVASTGTRLAVQRLIQVDGTERTPGALQVASRDAGEPLGSMLIHTCPDLGDGYTPELLDGYLSFPDGREVGDDAPSGFWYDGTLATMVPSYRYTSGSYMIVAWMESSAAQPVTITATVTTGAGPTGSDVTATEVVTRTVTMGAGETRGVPVGEVILPAIDNRTGAITVVIQHSATAETRVGGAWACRVGRDSALTFVRSNQPYLYLQAGARTTPSRILVSDTAGIENGWHPGPDLQYLGAHTFPAGGVQTLVVADNAPDPAVTLRYTPLWPWNPAHDGRRTGDDS